mmetsp:Transcript_31567/g.75367  ORF Transcript_31567/g.75367 Transcript_31567/m.75367 type:complete len:285 (-) Transcript_31567:53-907(-)
MAPHHFHPVHESDLGRGCGDGERVRHDEAAPAGGDAGGEPGAGGGVPGSGVARAADAAQRHHRAVGVAAAEPQMRRPDGQDAAADQDLRQAPRSPRQRHPRLRLRPPRHLRAQARVRVAPRGVRGRVRHAGAAVRRRRVADQRGGQGAGAAAYRGRREPHHPDRHQLHLQLHQVHRQGRHHRLLPPHQRGGGHGRDRRHGVRDSAGQARQGLGALQAGGHEHDAQVRRHRARAEPGEGVGGGARGKGGGAVAAWRREDGHDLLLRAAHQAGDGERRRERGRGAG